MILNIFESIKMKKQNIVSSDPERMSGCPVFRGTRVPIQALFDCLPYESIDEFLEGYPSVTKEMLLEFFDEMAKHFSMDKNWLVKKPKIYPTVKTDN